MKQVIEEAQTAMTAATAVIVTAPEDAVVNDSDEAIMAAAAAAGNVKEEAITDGNDEGGKVENSEME